MARQITDVLAPFMNNKPDAHHRRVPRDPLTAMREVRAQLRPARHQEKLSKGLPVSGDAAVSGHPG